MTLGTVTVLVVSCLTWALFGFAWWRMPTWARFVSPIVFLLLHIQPFTMVLLLWVACPWVFLVDLAAAAAGAVASAALLALPVEGR